MKNYTLHDTFLIRTPSLPFDGILKEIISTQIKTRQIDALKSVFAQQFMQEAIFLASPSLSEQLLKWLNNKDLSAYDIENLCLSLMRYLIRMSTRCTPFGLFAGCTVGKWGELNAIELTTLSSYKRHTRLDMDCLGNLVQNLSSLEEIQEYILFYPNNSLYRLGDKLRYIDYHYKDKRRIHQIVSISNSEYVSNVIENASNGSTIADLASKLISDDISFDESYSFIKEMIQEKVLISELDAVTTGEEMLNCIIKVLERLEPQSKIATDINISLKDIRSSLSKIDSYSIGNCLPEYEYVEDKLKELKFSFERNMLFQTDMLKPAQKCTMDKRLAGTIRRALEVLNKFTIKSNRSKLQKFKDNFIERYGTNEMSLSMVLDVEVGIGFHQDGENKGIYNAFIQDFRVNNAIEGGSQSIEWNQKESFLLKKLIEAQKEDSYEVCIQDKDIVAFTSNWDDVPDSLSVIGSIISSGKTDKYPKVFIKSANGYATHLLGRFTHLDEDINNWVCDIARQEQALYSEDTIYAEIVHLPESRTGNVLMRKVIRPYEIPYLAKSSVGMDFQIPISDLMVSIQREEIILRSKRLNKRIFPNLGNAHNYSYNALPVYDFLCSLQYQNLRGTLRFSWGRLAGEFKFLPRVSYHNIVLFQATWQLSKNDCLIIINADDSELVEVVTKWRTTLNIPPCILLVESDNELRIDLSNYLSIKVFIKEIKKKQTILIKEFNFTEIDNIVKDTEGYNYTNEFICVFNKQNKEAIKQRFEYEIKGNLIHDRTIHIGSDWLYYKIYCGVSIADDVLIDKIRSLTLFLQKENLISKWFFIRYKDPECHIRLRLQLTEKINLESVNKFIYESLNDFLEQQLISRIQIDTYEREIERYGDKTMSLSESIFCIDSETTLSFLNYNKDSAIDERWLYGLFSMDALLDAFEYKIEDKLRVLNILKVSFTKEFGNSDLLRKRLEKKFEKHNKDIMVYIDTSKSSDGELFLYQFIKEKEVAFKPKAKDIILILNSDFKKIDDLLCSYIHMLHNRLFIADQRKHELILYNFLFKVYQSFESKEKQSKIFQ